MIKEKINMTGRPRSKKGVKVHTAFKIYPKDKERAQAMAEKLDISLSSYINKAVLEKLAHDEKSEA
jgi:predicted HicB family RNase H-like nuclease